MVPPAIAIKLSVLAVSSLISLELYASGVTASEAIEFLTKAFNENKVIGRCVVAQVTPLINNGTDPLEVTLMNSRPNQQTEQYVLGFESSPAKGNSYYTMVQNDLGGTNLTYSCSSPPSKEVKITIQTDKRGSVRSVDYTKGEGVSHRGPFRRWRIVEKLQCETKH